MCCTGMSVRVLVMHSGIVQHIEVLELIFAEVAGKPGEGGGGCSMHV